MDLTYENYRAESDQGRFNLYATNDVVANKDTKHQVKGNVYEVESLIGYGYTFTGLVARITALEVERKNDTLLLSKYAMEYNRELARIVDLLDK